MILKKLPFILVLMLINGAAYAADPITFEQIKHAAEQGDALAQAKYGAIHFLGENFQLKANARFKTRQKLKAINYLLKGVQKDETLAARWLLKAANQGYADAEVFVAALYDRGMGVRQDESKATQYYQKASAHGNEMAAAVLGPYARSRLTASKDVPVEYSLKILNTQ